MNSRIRSAVSKNFFALLHQVGEHRQVELGALGIAAALAGPKFYEAAAVISIILKLSTWA